MTVPDDLWESALTLAEASGTTPNDVMVHLAMAGRELADRRVRLSRVAQERRHAYLAAGEDGEDAELPTAEEALHAAGALRRDLAVDDY